MTFLRGSTVLLSPGEIEGRINFSYSPEKSNYSYSSFQQRLFTTSLNVNIGVMDNLEAWVDIPFGHARARYDSVIPGTAGRENRFGLRDISLGANAVLINEGETSPEFNLAASVSIPTGLDSYDVDHVAYLGNDHWRGSLGFSLIKSLDPAIVYMGTSVGYYLPKNKYGAKFKYDPNYNYYLGLGMAINDKLSFSSRFEGSYQPPLKVNGKQEGRQATDPMWANIGFAYRLNSKYILEPQVTFGLNNEANSSGFSLGPSRKF